MKNFRLIKEFRNVGYFETEHHKQIFQELKMAIRQGKLIAVSGIVGSGKTTTLRKIRDVLSAENEIIVAKYINGLEQKLTRHGYNIKTLASTVNVQPKVIRSFLGGKLSPGQTQELQVEMLAAGIPI